MISDNEADRIDRLRNMKREMTLIGPRLPDRSFESSDWANDPSRWPLLILEYVDEGLDSIYGPYTNTADLMSAYARLTYFNPFVDPDGADDGYAYEIQPLKGRP
jgi:hypothetical protein